MAGLRLFGFFLVLFLSSSFRSIPVRAQFSPGNVPLASRSAYFNSRLDTRTPSSTASTWPTFGPPSLHTLGWAGYIKVDNTTWRWIGNSVAYNGTTVNTLPVTNTILTPTRTTFTMNANTLVQLNVSFLSPIPTDDLVGLSVPFAYVTVDAVSLDGAPHDVKVYSDISGEWLADDTKLIMEWDTVKTSPNIIHTSTLQTLQLYTDGNGQARWGTMYYATAAGSSVTYKVDSDINCRTQFQVSGTLDNAIMTAPPRGISDSWPVLAHAHDLGTISSSTPSSTPSVIIAIGFLRSPAVQLTNLDGDKQDRALFYETAYSDPVALVNDFIANYTAAAASSAQLDSQLTQMATGVDGGGGVGTQLADMVALGVRQVLSNTEVTVAKGTDGAWNASDVVMFMRQGDGQYNRTQPVELLYASFPMFMSLNPALGKPLLEPLLRLQSSSLYGNAYAAPDLSSTYPNASLANQPHQQGVEQTGNMLVMSYAQARYSGDSSMVETYYTLLRSWADYLVNNSLAIGTQLTTDTTTTRNQTNLAIKGILGVKAFSAIASGLGVSSDAKKYSDSASGLYSRWKSSGALGSAGNLLATFNSATSYSTGYNLFADKWLGLGVVEDDVYAAQTTLVKNLLGSSSATYGLPIDSTAGQVAITSWDMFVAALMTDPSARSSLVGKLYAHAGSSQFASPWPLEYNAQTGDVVSGTRGSPGQGAIFAPMALSLPTKTFSASSGFTPPPGTSSSTTSKSHAGAIAGGVVGGVAGLAILGLLIFFLRRRRRHNYELAKVEPLREQNGAGLYPHAVAMAQMNQNNASTSFHPEMLVRGDGTRPQHASNPSSSFVLPGVGGTTDERSGGSGYGGGAGGGGDAAAPVFAPTLPAVGPNGQPLSSKALMHLRHVQNGSPERSDPSALYTPPSEGSAGRRAPSSANGSGSGSGAVSSSGASTDQLRQEVDLLRREMAQIRAAGLDLPPGYE